MCTDMLPSLTDLVLCFVCTAIVTDVFQGSMRIFTKKLPHPDLVSGLSQVLGQCMLPEGFQSNNKMLRELTQPRAPEVHRASAEWQHPGSPRGRALQAGEAVVSVVCGLGLSVH